MARNYRDMGGKKYALNLHFEDFKKDFKSSVQKTLKHLDIIDKYGTKKVMEVSGYPISLMLSSHHISSAANICTKGSLPLWMLHV